MSFRKRLHEPYTLTRIGSVSLAAANLSLWLLHPPAGFWADMADLFNGIAFGIAIALLLLAARLHARRRAGMGRPGCA